MGEFVRVETDQAIATIRLERPPMNALNAQVQDEIAAAAAEVSAVLLGMAGQEPLEPAAKRLLTDTAGADLAWGLAAGCRAALTLSVS